MFTNEFEHDASITTILDESGTVNDVEVVIDDFGVYVRQYNDKVNKYDVVFMTHLMFKELQVAMNRPEGAYRIFFQKK